MVANTSRILYEQEIHFFTYPLISERDASDTYPLISERDAFLLFLICIAGVIDSRAIAVVAAVGSHRRRSGLDVIRRRHPAEHPAADETNNMYKRFIDFTPISFIFAIMAILLLLLLPSHLFAYDFINAITITVSSLC